jgi:hypothetical protein
MGTRAHVPTQAQAAEMLGVSTRAVKMAAKIGDEATPEVVAAVKGGEMSLRQAVKQIPEKPPEERPTRSQKLLPTRAKSDAERREHARDWTRTATALDAICGLPSPEHVIKGCQSPQSKQNAALRVVRAITWLNRLKELLENERGENPHLADSEPLGPA